MESRDVLKIHGALRRYCTSRVSLRSTLEVQYLLNLPCIFNTSLDSMVYLPISFFTLDFDYRVVELNTYLLTYLAWYQIGIGIPHSSKDLKNITNISTFNVCVSIIYKV